jgi:DNA topoisomerase III
MSKALIIAEKPSVASDLARALGGFKKVDDYFESDRYIISSAVGHLVELCLPHELDVKRGKWSFANLPIIPDEFELKPIEKTKPRFNLLKRLMKREDVDLLINACDAGREGELIFRYLLKLSGVKKTVQRLWLQSMTAESIRSAFDHLRSDEEMIPLAQAAVCRSESDWLVGINGTRAMTAFNNKTGGFQLTPVGRVQTPTLAILAEREEKIHQFKPRNYFEVFADFGVKAGNYRGRWFREDFSKDGDEDARAERIWEKESADAIKERCLGKTGVANEERKPTTQAPPLLYDLTSLQRDANGRGFSAKRTLQIAQQLYERHKVITYPRTDSRYLPEDYLNTVKATLSKIDNSLARKALENNWVKLSKRIFNNAKISDHFAIVPTGTAPHGLDEWQQKVYDMIVRRFIAVFYPAAQFEVTTRITRVEKDAFKTEGKIVKDPGWLAVYGREAPTAGSDGESLVPITENEPAKVLDIEVAQNETKPPARFNEATLLSAMEGAGKLVEDEELREAMREKGLGTPATRAAIIEGLIFDGYILREGRELIATAKGMALITLLRGIGVSELCSPEMTGEWEYKLKRMAKGGMARNEFMKEIREFTRDIVEKAKNFKGDSVGGDFEVLEVKCPKCGGGPFEEDYRTFKCRSCGLIVWKTMAGRLFESEEMKKLLTEGRLGPLQGFRSKIGRKFDAIVKLGPDFKQQFDFENGDAESQQLDKEKHEALGLCPICQKGQVYVLEKAYACENALASPKTCSFRISKFILQREIPREQVEKLIATGKTDLLPKFISKKGRAFSAHLTLANGKIGFEFAPKAPKKKKTPAPKVAAAA